MLGVVEREGGKCFVEIYCGGFVDFKIIVEMLFGERGGEVSMVVDRVRIVIRGSGRLRRT